MLRPSLPLALVMVATLSATTAHASDRPLRLASDVWPPFTGRRGQPKVAIELVERALSRAGLPAETSLVAVGQLTPVLEQELFDGTPAIWRSAKREKYLLFSKPYLENRLVLVGRKGSDVSAKSLRKLSGKRVAVVEAFAYGPELTRAAKTIFVRGPSDQHNLRELLAGRVDYMLVDDLLAFHLLHDFGADTKRLLAVGRTPLITRTLHFAVRRKLPAAKKIIALFNAEVGKMMADGSIHRILEVDWIRTDMDGDGRSELVLGGTKAGSKPPELTYDWLTLRKPKPGPRQKIWIEGVKYDNWDKVPRRYKVQPEPLDPQRDSGIELRFDTGPL